MSGSPRKASPKRAVSPKRKPKRVAKKPASHPPVAEMVVAAIKALKDHKGSSLAAIKKYMTATYKVDSAKLAPFIRRFVKKAVVDGGLKQASGTGASGRFRIGVVPKKPKKKVVAKKAKAKKVKKPKKKVAAKKPKAKKPKKKATPKKAKKPAAKKAKTAKKPAAKKPKAKKPAAKKPKAKKPKAKKAKK